MKCPVCGQHDFTEPGSFDICPICGWEDDELQNEDHNYAGGANDLSVNEARIEFFLLNLKETSDDAHRCKEKYEHTISEIYSRYAALNRLTEPKQAELEKRDFRRVRKEYLDALNRILHSISNH